MAAPRTRRRLPRSLSIGAPLTVLVMLLGLVVAGVAGAEEVGEDEGGLGGLYRVAGPRAVERDTVPAQDPEDVEAPDEPDTDEVDDHEYAPHPAEDAEDAADPAEDAADPAEDAADPAEDAADDPVDTGGSGVYVPRKLADEIVAGTPCTKHAVACVSLGAKKSWIFGKDADGNTVITHGPVTVSTGGPGKETPVGDFVVEWKNKNHRSSEFFTPHGCKPGTAGCQGAPMNWAVFFAEGGIAFHEGMLNQRSSGCVRLSAAEAKFYYDTLQLGDKVEVRG